MYPANPYKATYYRLIVNGMFLRHVGYNIRYSGSPEDDDIYWAEMEYDYKSSRRQARVFHGIDDLIDYLHEIHLKIDVSNKYAKKRNFAYHNPNIKFEQILVECTYSSGHCFKIALEDLINLKKLYKFSKKLNKLRENKSKVLLFNGYEPCYRVSVDSILHGLKQKRNKEKINYVFVFQFTFFNGQRISVKHIREIARENGIRYNKTKIENNGWTSLLLDKSEDVHLLRLLTPITSHKVIDINDFYLDYQGLLKKI
jgi:hypothetical protein